MFFLCTFAKTEKIMFKIIACINNRRCLGKNGRLIYHIHNDMQNFRRMTMGNVVVMGRKTFESLPKQEPLPGRINVILTSDPNYCIENEKIKDEKTEVYIVHTIDDVCELCQSLFPDKDWFLIGGATMFSHFMCADLVNEVRLTIVDDDLVGDAFFPLYDKEAGWEKYFETLPQDEDGVKYRYLFLKKC